ncbi:MAG: hypothetical protein VYE73_12085 [Acidobacteriota bacterium]|nr:hypothetical protein [Acidobacteriota bacterium]
MRFRYGEGFPRNLFAVATHEFHPGGADAVRIRFQVTDGIASKMTVHDPDIILTAERIP